MGGAPWGAPLCSCFPLFLFFLHLRRHRPHDDLLHALVVGLYDLHGEAVVIHQGVALVRDIPELLNHPTADRGRFGIDFDVEQALQLFDFGTGS